MKIVHKFVSTKEDGLDETLVKPSDWNDTHNFVLDPDGPIIIAEDFTKHPVLTVGGKNYYGESGFHGYVVNTGSITKFASDGEGHWGVIELRADYSSDEAYLYYPERETELCNVQDIEEISILLRTDLFFDSMGYFSFGFMSTDAFDDRPYGIVTYDSDTPTPKWTWTYGSLSSGNDHTIVSSKNTQSGSWQHIRVTKVWDGGLKWKLYIDGVLEGTGTIGTSYDGKVNFFAQTKQGLGACLSLVDWMAIKLKNTDNSRY